MFYLSNLNNFDVRIPNENYETKQFWKIEYRWIKRTQ